MDFISTLVSLLLFDLIWISLVAKPRFDVMITSIQGSPMKPDMFRVILSYIVLVMFAYIFIPKMNSYEETFLLGFLTYGIYETTSYALFDKWDPTVVVLDSVWGGILLCIVRYFALEKK